MHLSRRNSATKILYVKTVSVSDRVVRHLLTYLNVQKMVGGERPLKSKFSSSR